MPTSIARMAELVGMALYVFGHDRDLTSPVYGDHDPMELENCASFSEGSAVIPTGGLLIRLKDRSVFRLTITLANEDDIPPDEDDDLH